MRAWSSVGKGCLFFSKCPRALITPSNSQRGVGGSVEEEWLWLICEISPPYVIYVGTGLWTNPAHHCWAVCEPEQGCVVLEPAWMSLKLYQAVRTLLWWWHLVAPCCKQPAGCCRESSARCRGSSLTARAAGGSHQESTELRPCLGETQITSYILWAAGWF